jgi:hypothetical protein
MRACSLSAGACLHVVKPNIEIEEAQSCTDLETIGRYSYEPETVLKSWVAPPADYSPYRFTECGKASGTAPQWLLIHSLE